MTATQTLEAPNFGVMSSCSLWTGARDGHTRAELDAVAAALPDAATAHVMFNNVPRIGDARRFRDLVGGASPEPK
jgi:hypothetical protein